MTTILGARRDSLGNMTAFFDTNTSETIARMMPILLDDDFLGAGHTAGVPSAGAPVGGYPWVKKIVGAGPPTVSIAANGPGGIMVLALTSTSEKEDAALYAADQLTFDVTKGCVFEARIAFAALPGAAVEMVFGLQSAWIDGPDNAAFYAQFQSLASGLVSMRTKDGVNTLSASSGVTMVAGAYHIFKIDTLDVTNIIFSIDGTVVSTTGQFSFAATGANAVLQPYLSVYKASGASVGTMNIDMVQVSGNRV